MKEKKSYKIIYLITILIVFIIIYAKFYNQQNINSVKQTDEYKTICGEYKKGEVIIKNQKILVDISDNGCKRELGLSGRLSLNEEGMIFVFESDGNYGFWMKDMNFPIDIIWIDDYFRIVGIENNVSPNTYPESFGKKYLARYVLEVPAQYSDKNNIKVGDKIILEEK